MRGARLSGVLACAILSIAGSARAETSPACPTNRVPPLVLPRLRDAVTGNQEITIVALGSSTTAGWRASDLAHTYPALMQADLSTELPKAHVAVINRGVGGQDVAEELPRIDVDVLALKPTVVIWQVGANGAMRHLAPDLFKRLLTTGVKRLMDAKIDVVLMDNQKAPTILASPEHVAIDQAMADVATETGARLFARGALMDQWKEAGYPYERFVSDDGIHHNDYGYRCVTEALDQAIMDGLKQLVPPTQTAAKR